MSNYPTFQTCKRLHALGIEIECEAEWVSPYAVYVGGYLVFPHGDSGEAVELHEEYQRRKISDISAKLSTKTAPQGSDWTPAPAPTTGELLAHILTIPTIYDIRIGRDIDTTGDGVTAQLDYPHPAGMRGVVIRADNLPELLAECVIFHYTKGARR